MGSGTNGERKGFLSPINWWATLSPSPTRCARCDGLMLVEERIYGCGDLLEKCGPHSCVARRCVQCGNLIDPVVLLNRARRHRLTVETVARRRT